MKLQVFITILVLSLCFTACKQKNVQIQNSGLASQHILSHTTGVISKGASIQVDFAEPPKGDENALESIIDNIFEIKPNVSGKVSWSSGQSLVFIPDSELASGKTYTCTVQLGSLYDPDPGPFQFLIEVKKQDYSISFELPEPDENGKIFSLNGNIYTADQADENAVKKMLSADKNGSNVPITWTHSSEGRFHNFSITGLERNESKGTLKIVHNGSTIQVKKKGEKTFEIPAQGEFDLWDIVEYPSDDRAFTLVFSDRIDPSQNLKGLITIKGYRGKMRYLVEANRIHVFPEDRIEGENMVSVHPGIVNRNGNKIETKTNWNYAFTSIAPQLNLVGEGVIIPNSSEIVFPFEAVGLSAVDVEIFKIFNNNILQFLQGSQLGDTWPNDRIGRVIKQVRVDLGNEASSSRKMEQYGLNLSEFIQLDPNAIYQVSIGFRPEYARVQCDKSWENYGYDVNPVLPVLKSNGEIKSIWDDYYGPAGYYSGYSWDNREDPCFPEYYNSDRFVRRNVLVTDLGLLAKGGTGGSLTIVATNLRTTDPVADVDIDIYDFQQQLIKTVRTDTEGIVETNTDRKPFALVARKGVDKSFLKIQDQDALSLSRFDVSGSRTQKGLKGFIYGERAVWRPGDSLFLNFVLLDETGELPDNHPLDIEVRDPKGQTFKKWTSLENVGKIYPIPFATGADSPTGDWRVSVNVGGASFSKLLKIETIKPNRLKINIDAGGEVLYAEDNRVNVEISSTWLHGAPASNLKAKSELTINASKTKFEGFTPFVFDDPEISFKSASRVVYEGTLDESGRDNFPLTLLSNKNVPGKLNVQFKTRVFEQSGNASTDYYNLPFYPYESFSGVAIPENRYKQKRADIGKPLPVEFAAVNQKGESLAGRKLNVSIHRVNWRWWWERTNSRSTDYSYNSSKELMDEASITTGSGGKATWNVNIDNWGRYVIKVCDPISGHCSGDFLWAGYPWYEDNTQAKQAAAMLTFSSGKSEYKVGERVKLSIPASALSKGFISLENGSKVVEHHWFTARDGDNTFEFEASPEMAPTIYAHVSLIQPHAQTDNDLPIRMYGVIPISIEDPNSKLEPVIAMPDELRPETPFNVTVKEQTGKPMAYTISIVDEGLLDLTRFQTPNPWSAFFARAALGVKTWDVYQYVLGALGGPIERLLSIGGDGESAEVQKGQQVSRFKPVVKNLGPFYLKKNGSATHKISLPNYIGSVRAMVVSCGDNAYGKTEKTCPVRKPVMVLPTFPRVLSPGDEVNIPVSIFTMNDNIKNVKVNLEASDNLIKFDNANQVTIPFEKQGEKMAYFPITVGQKEGVATFKVKAVGGNETAYENVEIAVRNPNPEQTNVAESIVEAGAKSSLKINWPGMPGSNKGILEISSIPPMDLNKRLRSLISYPYGCIEQTTSAVFPQLFLTSLVDMDDGKKQQVRKNITAGINRLQKFQVRSGGFAYWPGNSNVNEWSTTYGGHFLLEAKALGYLVPDKMMDKWLEYQKNLSRIWNSEYRKMSDIPWHNHLSQAYRLYTLALAGQPDLAAMNRMRSSKRTDSRVTWRLAGAYALAGKPEVAKELVQGLSSEIKPYTELSYTYGSGLRDEAMILEALNDIEQNEDAAKLVRRIAEKLRSGQWYNTQAMSYALLAIGKYIGNDNLSTAFKFTVSSDGNTEQSYGSSKPVFNLDIPESTTGSVTIQNTSQQKLFTRLFMEGRPAPGEEEAFEENLAMKINYVDEKGISLDPFSLPKGTDFTAIVQITNPGNMGIDYREMALSQIFPSGWEITSSRLGNAQKDDSKYVYRDIRDDRVQTFFHLARQKSVTYKVHLNAAYEGKYYMPAVLCEAMYDKSIQSRSVGKWVNVTSN